jgi:hypothetical protein
LGRTKEEIISILQNKGIYDNSVNLEIKEDRIYYEDICFVFRDGKLIAIE